MGRHTLYRKKKFRLCLDPENYRNKISFFFFPFLSKKRLCSLDNFKRINYFIY